MSERTEPNLNEMINSAGDGSGLQLPPAFVMVNPKQHRKYKKNNETIDGRTKGARSLFDRIQRRKMKEETNVTEALSTDTERAQKQITQTKKLNRSKDLQKKRGEAKQKMMNKTKDQYRKWIRSRHGTINKDNDSDKHKSKKWRIMIVNYFKNFNYHFFYFYN